MTRPLIPFVQNGYYASRNWIPLVKGNGFTTSGGGEQEEVWETASGSIVTFDAVAAPLRQLSVAVEPVQSGTGDPSPTNVRPITGFDSVTVNRTGKNLLPPQEITGGMSNVQVSSNGDKVTINGTASAYGQAISANTLTLDAGTYFLEIFVVSGSVTNGSVPLQLRSASGATTYVSTATGASFTLQERTELKFRVTYGSGAVISNYIIQPMIVSGSTAPTAYEPYQGNEYTIQLGETVYGGTLDVVNGKMTVDRAMVDLGTLAWSYTGTLFMTLVIPGIKPPPDGNTVPNCICEAYKAVAYSRLSATDPSFTIIYEGSSNSGRLWLKDSTFTTLDSFKSFISGKHLCYELAAPFELTLTPEQVSTLQGTNNVWSDAGDVTVEYRAQ